MMKNQQAMPWTSHYQSEVYLGTGLPCSVAQAAHCPTPEAPFAWTGMYMVISGVA